MQVKTEYKMEVSGKHATSGQTICDLCKIQGKEKLADGFCSDCNEYMCSNCFQIHVVPRPCRNHVLGSLAQSRSPTLSDVKPEYCKTHKTETVRYYCPVHDTIACGDCAVADHNECKMIFITDLATKFEESTEFQDILKKLKAMESEVNESEKHCKKYQLEKKTVLDTVLGDIRKFRKELNDFLDNAEKEIIHEAKTLIKENEKSLAEIEQNIVDLLSKISKLSNELDPKSYQDVTLFIRYTERKSSINDIEQRLSVIKSTHIFPTITFAPDQTLKEMLKSKPKFGHLKTESQLLFGTDPRAHGFDVGTRVRWERLVFMGLGRRRVFMGLGRRRGNGVVTKVDPNGYVDVQNENGYTTTCIFAGAEGMFQVYLEK